MMSEADDKSAPRPNDHEALQRSRERARDVRRQIVQELTNPSGVTDRTKIRAAQIAIDYRDVLVDYREELAAPPWDERELDWIMELVGETTTREQPQPGVAGGTEIIDRPAFADLNAVRLYQLTKKFDQIWRELGFGAETDTGADLHQVPDGSEHGRQS